MGIFDYLKSLTGKDNNIIPGDADVEAVKSEVEQEIRQATKQGLKDLEDMMFKRFAEVEEFVTAKQNQVKQELANNPNLSPESLAHLEEEVDKFLLNASAELDEQVDKLLHETSKKFEGSEEVVMKRFQNVKTLIKATSGMGSRANREFFDAVRTIIKK